MPAGEKRLIRITFMELASRHPELLMEAVAQSQSPYKALSMLGFGGSNHRASQLCDAIMYYDLDTSHWHEPLEKVPATRDYSPTAVRKPGSHGYDFEDRFSERVKELIALRIDYRFFQENELSEFIDVVRTTHVLPNYCVLAAWDGLLYHKNSKNVILFEVKSSAKGTNRLKKQIVARENDVKLLENLGFKVTIVAIVGHRIPANNLEWVRFLNERDVMVTGLTGLTHEFLNI